MLASGRAAPGETFVSLDDLLARNRAWAEARVAEDAAYFTRQMGGQRPHLLWIGCSDSRVPAEQILDCGPGELFIHRNVANIVAYNDINIASVIQYATQYLMVPDIVICGHYGCGGVEAACAGRDLDGYVGDWLYITEGARRAVERQLEAEGRKADRVEFLRLVVEANVRLQISHMGHLSVLRQCWTRTPGVPRLHGWAYDMATGLINVIVDGRVPSPAGPLRP
jgi:carbonic anhydrase